MAGDSDSGEGGGSGGAAPASQHINRALMATLSAILKALFTLYAPTATALLVALFGFGVCLLRRAL